MSRITTKPIWSEDITKEVQDWFDDLEIQLNERLLGPAIIFESYTVATVPEADENGNGVIIVSDEAGGRTLATSDGTNWRRVSDGAIIS